MLRKNHQDKGKEPLWPWGFLQAAKATPPPTPSFTVGSWTQSAQAGSRGAWGLPISEGLVSGQPPGSQQASSHTHWGRCPPCPTQLHPLAVTSAPRRRGHVQGCTTSSGVSGPVWHPPLLRREQGRVWSDLEVHTPGPHLDGYVSLEEGLCLPHPDPGSSPIGWVVSAGCLTPL